MSTLQASVELYKTLPVVVNADTCSGKVYIVTGSNTGLGLETARHLVGASAKRVIVAVRNVTAGEKAKNEIETSTGRKGVIDVWPLDLSSFASVNAFAEKAAELDKLDCVIANAGVMLDQWTTAEGMETCVTVNVISTMLMGVLLMPKLVESGRKFGGDRPRIVFVVSTLGFQSKKEFEKSLKGNSILTALNDPKGADMDQRYAVTKLVEIYAVRQFATLFPVEKTGVVANMVAPGLCSTGLDRNARTWTQTWIAIARAMMARTAEQGSRTILFGAVVGEESHGKLLSGCKIKDFWVPNWVTEGDGPRVQKQIWTEIAAWIEKANPGCLARIS